MKVTKAVDKNTRKVVAFYTTGELVFRNKYDKKNTTISNGAAAIGGFEFDTYCMARSKESDFIAFYEGDTIQIELALGDDL